MNIKIHNIRLGFANNSSSSHSIIFLRDSKLKAPDPHKLLTADNNFPHIGHSYGWEGFCLDTPASKADYLLTAYYGSLPSELNNRQKAAIMKELFGATELGDDGENDTFLYDIYIDHQSQANVTFKTGNHQNFADFFRFVVNNPAVTIWGGNDNDGTRYSGPGERISIPPQEADMDQPWGNWRMKKDGDNFIYFNKETGAKTRLYMGVDPSPADYTKATVPELVDLKITNKCLTGCEFCYQGSTESGEHADLKFLKQVFTDLDSLGVFEVAIGGGEPTIHPHFDDIMSNYGGFYCRNDMKKNLTTYDMSWWDGDTKRGDTKRSNWNKIAEGVYHAGSFAISNVSKENLAKLLAWNSRQPTHQGSIQLIEGVHSKDGVDRMLQYLLDSCRVEENGYKIYPGLPRITLLGYKTTGRGADYQRKDSDWISDLLKGIVDWKADYHHFKWAIDTQLVKNYGKELEEENYSHVLYHEEEGKFSCYVDCVSRMVYRSSYELDDGFEYTTAEDFVKNFARF